MRVSLLVLMVMLLSVSTLGAKNLDSPGTSAISVPMPNFKVTNEMLYRELMEIKLKLAQHDEKFKSIDQQRFEAIDRRFEAIEQRFDEIDAQFDRLYSILLAMTGVFTTLVVAVITLIFWDRRTMLKQAKKEVTEGLQMR